MKDRKPMPRAVQFVLVALALLVLGLGGWFVLLRPQGAKLTSVKADETTAQRTLADYQQRVAAARSAPRIDVADVYRLATAMPAETDMPDLILQLSQLARDTGIRFDSISPQPMSAVGSYSALPISITLNGNFYNLADFLYRLRALVSVHNGRLDATGRLFEVDNMAFSESPLKFPKIQATLVIDAFVYGSGAGTASAVASPAPPASAPATTTSETTTTSTTETTTTTGTTTTPTTTTTPQGSSAAGAP
jgi:type IV pilus assembly protein PilO